MGTSIVAAVELAQSTFRGLAVGVEPSWSPQGDRIAFFDLRRRNCFTVPARGGRATLLFSSRKGILGGGRAPLFYPVVWSPDGKRLLWHEWMDADLLTDIYARDLTTGRVKSLGRSEMQVVDWR